MSQRSVERTNRSLPLQISRKRLDRLRHIASLQPDVTYSSAGLRFKFDQPAAVAQASRHIRYDAHAEPGADQFEDRYKLIHFALRHEPHARMIAEGERLVPQTVPVLENQQPLLCELVQKYCLGVCKRMVLRHRQIQG